MSIIFVLPTAIAIQQLLSLPALRRAWISCRFIKLPVFLCMWDRCSPNITHLEVHCLQHGSQQGTEVLPPIPQCSAPLRLRSLRITFLRGVADWLRHPWCPFDISGLKAISIADNTEILGWQKIRPALKTIEVLDFFPHHIKPIDLSLLPNLRLLRIHVTPGQVGPLASGTLATIAPKNCISKIVIAPLDCSPHWQQVDRILVALPVGHVPIVEFEMPIEKYDRVVSFLPHMSKRNMLLRTDPTDNRWFERFVETM
ncbi:hypothetical protein C8R44DRAFT_865316 [Mycena epipterygia]|nr:hypothetical protein C8R44DRAFT_865316 [Mycena epipterygia]